MAQKTVSGLWCRVYGRWYITYSSGIEYTVYGSHPPRKLPFGEALPQKRHGSSDLTVAMVKTPYKGLYSNYIR